jgi:hypothetical protein
MCMKRILLSDPNPEIERLVDEAGWEAVVMDPTGDIQAQIDCVDVVLPEPFSPRGRLLSIKSYERT